MAFRSWRRRLHPMISDLVMFIFISTLNSQNLKSLVKKHPVYLTHIMFMRQFSLHVHFNTAAGLSFSFLNFCKVVVKWIYEECCIITNLILVLFVMIFNYNNLWLSSFTIGSCGSDKKSNSWVGWNDKIHQESIFKRSLPMNSYEIFVGIYENMDLIKNFFSTNGVLPALESLIWMFICLCHQYLSTLIPHAKAGKK